MRCPCVTVHMYLSTVDWLHPLITPSQATCKHFDVYAGPENIPVSRFSFDATETGLKPSSLPSRHVRLQGHCRTCAAAGSLSYMCSYNAINGVPSCANRELLRELLRGEWNFTGFVVSDCGEG